MLANGFSLSEIIRSGLGHQRPVPAEKLSVQVRRGGRDGVAERGRHSAVGGGRGRFGGGISRCDLDHMEIGALGKFRNNAHEHSTLRIHDYSTERSELEAARVSVGFGRTGEELMRLR